MSTKSRKLIKNILKNQCEMDQSEAEKIEEKIYNMCKSVSEKQSFSEEIASRQSVPRELSFSDFYTKIAYEKVGQFVSHPEMKKDILKDISKNVVNDWKSVVYEEFRKIEMKDNSHQVIGMKVEKGIFRCKNQKCWKNQSEGWNCTFYAAQLRSADEGMDPLVVCHDCKQMFKP